MDNQISLYNYFSDANVVYLTSGFTQCWESWRYENITPAYNKLYYICDGEFYLKINDKEYYCKKNQMFFLPYNSTQSYYHFSENFAVKHWVHFTTPCKDRDLSELITLPNFINVDDTEYVTGLFEQIQALNDDVKISSHLHIKACILNLLGYYIERSNPSNTTGLFKDEKLAELMTYIESNLQSPLTIEDLSEKMHFHPNYFIRYFKHATNLSPMQYICNLRIEYAKRMLQTDGYAIQEIASKVGFRSAYYFSRIFKRLTGFTPSAYRLISSSKPILPDEEQ